MSANTPTRKTENVLAGPMLRRLESRRIVFWLATREPCAWRLSIKDIKNGAALVPNATPVRIGRHCFLYLLDFVLDSDLPTDQALPYDLQWQKESAGETENWVSIREWAPDLCQDGHDLPQFVKRTRLASVLHGSCRKPHYPCEDGLVAADHWLNLKANDPASWPAFLMLTGDQVYVDDVAGPMLTAIHELIEELGLYDEQIEEALVPDSQTLYKSEYNYYRRSELLPDVRPNDPLRKRFFEGAKKPVFTTSSADNHLVTLAEILAMYLLVWSPVTWDCLPEGLPAGLSPEETARYRKERETLTQFIGGLKSVRRVLAHMPTLMIFDDHDVTDDWNLTADWEQTAYGHPFSRRIIGNALVGYMLCQGWGNNPDAFKDETLKKIQTWSQSPTKPHQDDLIHHLLHFHHWEYSLDTKPKLLVMDTRTRRWRSERNLNRPSGLMDWEALTELQTELLNHDSVVMVSPAPIFGVKLIEVVQKCFSLAGKPLLVDAENWMAHKGTAGAILNIFRHTRTPAHFVILSGDVHYSFVYGIQLKSQRGVPHLWQITSSGIKNEFPRKLLDTLDRLSRWLYSPRSPLNYFTRRRGMKINPFKPETASHGERLLNQAGIGYVEFAEDGKPTYVEQISMQKRTQFRLDVPEESSSTPGEIQ